jgi:molecular chaperone GrpE (heat shock protein)
LRELELRRAEQEKRERDLMETLHKLDQTYQSVSSPYCRRLTGPERIGSTGRVAGCQVEEKMEALQAEAAQQREELIRDRARADENAQSRLQEVIVGVRDSYIRRLQESKTTLKVKLDGGSGFQGVAIVAHVLVADSVSRARSCSRPSWRNSSKPPGMTRVSTQRRAAWD